MKLIKRSRISNDSRRSVTSGRFAFLLGICCILVGLHTTWSYAEDKVVELTFTFWGSPFEKQAIEKAVASFNATHPSIHVTAQHTLYEAYGEKLAAMVAAGTPPDV